MNLDRIAELIAAAGSITDKALAIGKLIEAGAELVHVVRSNVEEAAASLSEHDAEVLRKRAADLALTNKALAEQLDSALRG